MPDMTDIEIERNKDKLDLSPNVEFVVRNIAIYQQGLQNLLDQPSTEESREFANSVRFENLEDIVQPQVNPDEIKSLLSVMPSSLVKLSKLEVMEYDGTIPIPIFDEYGEFTGEADFVYPNEFPRIEDHPSRILVGRSDGTIIVPSPIPKTVSTNEEGVKMYQIHVFLHEFFHTVVPYSTDPEDRKAITLEYDGEQFTMQDFWENFEKLYLKKDQKSVSMYAATYSNLLNKETRDNNPDKFNWALAEQIAESFVGYKLGILSNHEDHVDFMKEHHEEYMLMDKLCKAEVLMTK